MITIQLNGEAKQISEAQPLDQVLNELTGLPENFAIAVNEDFVPRSQYQAIEITEGDHIELLVPMQGG
ncbi:MAG: hypothetical protein AseanaTS_05080 [Candidatus Pelagadaptatus aseana]|uniref:sulfur carrier protein ThiS n=1 Tax=Candidatus Pelagadaptatus aseana TaxID=3120508 RepID=UPI0039B1AAB6